MTLELLANPLNATLLKQLSEGPKRLADLRRDGTTAPQTTVRAHLKGLEKADLAVLQSREGQPRVVEWMLTDSGRDLLSVASALEYWLRESPDQPLELGSDAGKMAVNALLGGWASKILCLLAAAPLTLTELAEYIKEVSYPGLERRLSAMRLAGQVEAIEGDGKGTPYQVTEWLQQGITPLAAGIRWEYTHQPDEAAPLTRTDTTAAFLLSLPLVRLKSNLRGTCGLGVEVHDDEGPYCGAVADVDRGKVVTCSPELKDDVDASAIGTPPDWARAMLEASADPLELEGEKKLATSLVQGLHDTFFVRGTATQPLL